jgi:hypothetical protein
VDSEWSPQKVAELYEHAEQARERAEALAKLTTTAGPAADETPSAHPQAGVAGGPQRTHRDLLHTSGTNAVDDK